MATTTRYTIHDATTGKQIWTNYTTRPRIYRLKKTAECDIPWTTTEALWRGEWRGDMTKIQGHLSRLYGKLVALKEDGVVEYFNV